MARILLAEDEDSLRSMLALALTNSGHEVVESGNGAEALTRLVREGGRFDLLLSDIHMPAMDGLELAQIASRNFPALTILLMSGHDNLCEEGLGLGLIIHDVVAKPFTLASLCKAVHGAVSPRRLH